MEAAPERAVSRLGKGRRIMKALLLEKWGGNYAGQVLTNVEKGSIPASVARFYEDDEPTPNDVVKEETGSVNHLPVKNDSINPDHVDAVEKTNAARMKAAKDAVDAPAVNAADEQEFTQRQAREADEFAAKRAKGAKKAAKASPKDKKKAEAGKAHGVK